MVNWNEIGAISTLGAFAVTFGAVAGRSAKKLIEERSAWRDELKAMHDALVGVPATPYTPARKGLVEVVAELQRRFERHQYDKAIHR